MSVHRRGNGYQTRYREGTKQKSATFSAKRYGSMTEAKKQARAFDSFQRERRNRGESVMRRKDSPTLNDFAKQWFASKMNLSPKTEATYLSSLQVHILPHLGHLRLSELTLERLEEWQSSRLDNGAGPTAVRMAGKLLGTILERAVVHGYLEVNRARHLERPQPKRRRLVPATCEQIEQIRKAFLDRDRLGYATMVSVLAYVGCRRQDLHALEWKHLDGSRLTIEQKVQDDGTIVAGTKTGEEKVRVVDIPLAVCEDLALWRKQTQTAHGLIFPDTAGRPWTKALRGNWNHHWFNPIAKDAGWPFPPRDLRHSCASLMLASGCSPIEVATHLGHTLGVSVQRYQHLVEQYRGKMVPLDRRIAQARAEVFGYERARAI